MVEQESLKKTCESLLSLLNEREREVVTRRFGLFGANKETLREVGDTYNISRERVRQIEERALRKIKKRKELYGKTLALLFSAFKRDGGVKREETILKEWGGEAFLFFELDPRFQRSNKDDEFASYWYIGKDYEEKFKAFIKRVISHFKRERKPLSLGEISKIFKIRQRVAAYYLEIPKRIGKNPDRLYGFIEWPEIKPRNVGQKAYILLKKLKKPLHFTEIARLLENVKAPTLHNVLIKDEKFVLIGRGIYGLREWGYYPGTVKDVVLKILRDAKRPLTKEEIMREVLKQRIVKPTTVVLSLSDRNHFEKIPNGRYRLKTSLA